MAPQFAPSLGRDSLLGIISRKFTSHTTEGDEEIAKYFVPAVAIRDFMPVEFRC
jgi:hypothetical protein